MRWWMMGCGMGEVVLAVSFDIANAFNSLPWPVIRDALMEKRVPGYLRCILHSYLSDRWLSYIYGQG